MTAAFQASAFQNDAFQINGVAVARDLIMSGDLDKGGTAFQRLETFLGPSLGKTIQQVKPTVIITDFGIYNVRSASIILVVAGGATTFNLPDVRSWMRQPGLQPVTAFDRSIWIKDFGGNASNFNITVNPFFGQTIDGLGTFVIISNHFLLRLYPMNDLSGWYSG